MGEIEELREQNVLLIQQLSVLQQLMLGMQEEKEPEGYILVRSKISGYTSLQHPDPRFRNATGNVAISPYSEVLLSSEWKKSPNLDVSVRKGVVEYKEIPSPPKRLIQAPEFRVDTSVQEPEHKRIAWGFALLGADSQKGDITTYPPSVQALLNTDLETPGGAPDAAYMQEVVVPVLQEAQWLEAEWRNRKWVLELLDERITQIMNLTRRRF